MFKKINMLKITIKNRNNWSQSRYSYKTLQQSASNEYMYNICFHGESRKMFMVKCPKISYTKVPDKMVYANSANSDQTAPLDQSYLGLHCHSTSI